MSDPALPWRRCVEVQPGSCYLQYHAGQHRRLEVRRGATTTVYLYTHRARRVLVLICELTDPPRFRVGECDSQHIPCRTFRLIEPCPLELVRELQIEAIDQCVRLDEDELCGALRAFLELLTKEVFGLEGF